VPPGMVVDHINRNKLDNRRENLRICTMAENSYNRTKIKTIDIVDNIKKPRKIKSKYKGVKKDNKNEWSASITKDGKKYEMKHLPDEITAAKMYDVMSEELFGVFCAKNNPIDIIA
jgi:restriction endonuclease S subunit